MPYLYNFFLEIFTSKKMREGKILGVFLPAQTNIVCGLCPFKTVHVTGIRNYPKIVQKLKKKKKELLNLEQYPVNECLRGDGK